jgi:hypothetical protein
VPDLTHLAQGFGAFCFCLQLMGFWVANTLSERQLARFYIYSWPYYPLCSALAEAAFLLQPTQGSSSSSSSSSSASDDVREADEYMCWRRAGMQAELVWVMQQERRLLGEGLHQAMNGRV